MHGPLDRYPSACNDVAHLRAAGRGKVYRILRPRARLLNRRRQGGRSTKLRNCYCSHCSSAAADERVQEFDGGCPRASDDVLGQPTGFGMWSWGYASKGIGAIPCESRRLGLSSRRPPSPRPQVHFQGLHPSGRWSGCTKLGWDNARRVPSSAGVVVNAEVVRKP
jgi:hypothetical protein